VFVRCEELEPRTLGAAALRRKHKGMRPRSNGTVEASVTAALDSDNMKESPQMATTTRSQTRTISMPSAPDEAVPEPVTQRKRADDGRFRLQVDRQTKASYATYEAAEKAGLEIKKEHPILQVAVYDGIESVNKIIESPQS
jgi:hypothetical protein